MHPDHKDVEELKQKTAEELALILMRLASQQLKMGMFLPADVKDDKGVLTGVPLTPPPPEPSPPPPNAVTIETSEAWNWAKINGMIMDAPGTSANVGWKVLTRKGLDAVEEYRKAQEEPKGQIKEPLAPRVAPPRAASKP